MKHYVCTGSCNGESPTPGNCKDTSCQRFNAPLEECNCTDGTHKEVKEKKDHHPHE